mgnify:CR=1 FL=1
MSVVGMGGTGFIGANGAGMRGTNMEGKRRANYLGMGLKGQYFSFDAIIATVIMVLATTSLLAYWYGAQSVVDSRTGPLYADSLRIAGSLLSPGSPSNWADKPDFSSVKQLGLSDDFSNHLNRSKIEKLNEAAGVFYSSSPPASESNYTKVGRILRSPAEYYIVIERTDGNSTFGPYTIGYSYPANAREVAIAHRGATIDGMPVRLRVFLWRK